MKYLKVIDNKNLVRDVDSNGILNIDNGALNKYKTEREKRKKIDKMINEHDEMKSDILEIKNMLSTLLERKKE